MREFVIAVLDRWKYDPLLWRWIGTALHIIYTYSQMGLKPKDAPVAKSCTDSFCVHILPLLFRSVIGLLESAAFTYIYVFCSFPLRRGHFLDLGVALMLVNVESHGKTNVVIHGPQYSPSLLVTCFYMAISSSSISQSTHHGTHHRCYKDSVHSASRAKAPAGVVKHVQLHGEVL